MKTTKLSKHVVVAVKTLGCDLDGFDFAVIKMDRNAIKKRRTMIPEVPNLWSVQFWDYSAHFFDSKQAEQVHPMCQELMDNLDQQYVILPPTFIVPDGCSRSDVNLHVFTKDDMFWTCSPKHTDIDVETHRVDYGVLKR